MLKRVTLRQALDKRHDDPMKNKCWLQNSSYHFPHISITTIIFVLVGKPRELLILAGAVNGLILPIALAIILIAATKKRLMKGYHHPLWMQLSGWFVVVAMSWMGYLAVMEMWGKW